MLNIKQLYQDFHLNGITSGHKHCSGGWIHIECPFCSGNLGYHLGYCFDIQSRFFDKFVCWRCGGKSQRKALSGLLRISTYEADEIIRKYTVLTIQKKKEIKRKSNFKFPGGMTDLLPHHETYLKKRKFDPELIKNKYGVRSTGPLAPLEIEGKTLDYSHRIIIPVEWEGEIVSFQGRDITGKHKLKYIACPQELEIIEHKTIYYGNPINERCVIVEGVTDVWRLGNGAIALFGIKYRLEQIRKLAKMKEVFLLFDPESQARKQAEKIYSELCFRGIKCWKLPDLKTDPGDMEQEEADELMFKLEMRK